MHYHKEKVYNTCFVDFRKAFDSLCLAEGLFYKLLKTNIGGRLYNLMKNLYWNSTCSMKIGENKTQPFSYSRGVRQGCILSPLLFNLYLKNLPHLFENTLSDPFVLPNGKKHKFTFVRRWFSYSIKIENRITELFKYAAVSWYCDKWELKINPKKTKIIIFQKRPKKFIDIKFNIGSESTEIIQENTLIFRYTFNFNGKLFTCTRTLKREGPFTRFLVFGRTQVLINLILIPHPKFLTQWYCQS